MNVAEKLILTAKESLDIMLTKMTSTKQEIEEKIIENKKLINDNSAVTKTDFNKAEAYIKSRTLKYRGFNFHYGDSNWTPDLDRLYKIADEQIAIGSNSVSCVIYLYIDDEDWNFSLGCDIDNIKLISKYLYEHGVATTMLKVHWLKGAINKVDYNNIGSLFLTNLKTNVYDKLIPTLKECGLEIANLTNERPQATSINASSKCKKLLSDLSTYLKGQGLKTTCCFVNPAEYADADPALLDSLDVVCLNDYTPVSYKGLNSTVEECTNFLIERTSTNTMLKLVKDKPLIISETGCMDYVESLSSPAKWDYTEEQKVSSNGIIQNIFYTSWLNYLDAMQGKIMGVYFWDSTFSGFRPTENTKKTLTERWNV